MLNFPFSLAHALRPGFSPSGLSPDPTGTFPIYEEIFEFYVIQERRATGFKAPNLW